MPNKSIFVSKTFWLNFIMGILMVLTSQDILTILPANSTAIVAAITAVLNIVLRMLTNTTVTVITPKE